MSDSKTDFGAAFYSHSLSEVDREVARLASICSVRLLDPGVIERVLANDAGVCGTSNAVAFEKLRNVLMMHYAVRDQAVAALGATDAQALIEDVVKRLRERIGADLGG